MQALKNPFGTFIPFYSFYFFQYVIMTYWIQFFKDWSFSKLIKIEIKKHTKQSNVYIFCDSYYYGYSLLACLVSILFLIVFTISVLYYVITHLGGLSILIQCVLTLNKLHVVCRIWQKFGKLKMFSWENRQKKCTKITIVF
jgi:hypothetical protein